MKSPDVILSLSTPALKSGSGAAAILAAGVGSFAVAVLALAGDKSVAVKKSLTFYQPTGPLSGVTTVAILVWLFFWGILEWRWGKRDVALRLINTISLTLLVLSLLLTFPPIVDML